MDAMGLSLHRPSDCPPWIAILEGKQAECDRSATLEDFQEFGLCSTSTTAEERSDRRSKDGPNLPADLPPPSSSNALHRTHGSPSLPLRRLQLWPNLRIHPRNARNLRHNLQLHPHATRPFLPRPHSRLHHRPHRPHHRRPRRKGTKTVEAFPIRHGAQFQSDGETPTRIPPPRRNPRRPPPSPRPLLVRLDSPPKHILPLPNPLLHLHHLGSPDRLRLNLRVHHRRLRTQIRSFREWSQFHHEIYISGCDSAVYIADV